MEHGFMYTTALMKMTRCIDRVYCLSDSQQFTPPRAPHSAQEYCAKNINLHASQLSGGSQQTGTSGCRFTATIGVVFAFIKKSTRRGYS